MVVALVLVALMSGCRENGDMHARPDPQSSPATASRALSVPKGTASAANDTGTSEASASGLGAVPQVMVLGIDGVSPEVLQRMVFRGKAPNLARLIAEGTSGTLRSIEPFFSPEIWTTIATGRLPEDHGIRGFTYTDPQTTELRPTNTRQRKVPALWNIASQAGLTIGVVGWLCTWPPEPVNGFMVSNCFFMPQNTVDVSMLLDPAVQALHPPALALEVADKLVPTEKVTLRTLQRHRLQELARNPMNLSVFSKDMSFFNIARHLAETRRPDILMVYFQGIDILNHNNWPMYEFYVQESGGPTTPFRFDPETLAPHLGDSETQPRLSGQARELLMAQGQLYEHYFRYLDDCVGELLAIRCEGPRLVCVLSDHGYGRHSGDVLTRTGDQHYTKPEHWHLPDGIIVLHGPGIRTGHQISDARVQDVFPTLASVLRLPLARNLAGRSLKDAFDPAYLSANPETGVTAYDFSGVQTTTGTLSSEAEKKILQQLRSLGYIR